MRTIISPSNHVNYGSEDVDHLLGVETPHPSVDIHDHAGDGEAPGDEEQDQRHQLQCQSSARLDLYQAMADMVTP